MKLLSFSVSVVHASAAVHCLAEKIWAKHENTTPLERVILRWELAAGNYQHRTFFLQKTMPRMGENISVSRAQWRVAKNITTFLGHLTVSFPWAKARTLPRLNIFPTESFAWWLGTPYQVNHTSTSISGLLKGWVHNLSSVLQMDSWNGVHLLVDVSLASEFPWLYSQRDSP